jgi:hypothetical protein
VGVVVAAKAWVKMKGRNGAALESTVRTSQESD